MGGGGLLIIGGVEGGFVGWLDGGFVWLVGCHSGGLGSGWQVSGGFNK